MTTMGLMQYLDEARSRPGLLKPYPVTVPKYRAMDEIRGIAEGVDYIPYPQNAEDRAKLDDWNDKLRIVQSLRRDNKDYLLSPEVFSFKSMDRYAKALQDVVDQGKITPEFAKKMFANTLVEGPQRADRDFPNYGVNITLLPEEYQKQYKLRTDEHDVFPIYTELTKKPLTRDMITSGAGGPGVDMAYYAIAKMLAKQRNSKDEWDAIRAWNGQGRVAENGKVVADANQHVRKVQDMYKLMSDPINEVNMKRFKQPFLR